jgi:hypothetical protein
MSDQSKLIWHYTVGMLLSRIVNEGIIRPATAFVEPDERKVVWFSKNQEWEETANKGLYDPATNTRTLFNKEETATRAGGLVRIGVLPEVAPLTWEDFKRLSGINPKMARALYQGAIQSGARPGEWRATFDLVPKEKWQAVEIWQDGKWSAWDGTYTAAMRPVYPLAAFIQPFDSLDKIDLNGAMLPILLGADVVYGRDVMTGNEFLVFGRDALEQTRAGKPDILRTLAIEIDQATDELEMLIALMRVQKGRDDYEGEAE